MPDRLSAVAHRVARHRRPGVQFDLEAGFRRAGGGHRAPVGDQFQPPRRAGQRLVPQPRHQRPLRHPGQRTGADQRHVDVAAPGLVRAEPHRPGRVPADQVGAEHVPGGGDQVVEVTLKIGVHEPS
ncbi:hypothetical protein ABZS77_13750 [Micromonospora sp. NPDC005298]|uniref:hypothetical protein n=1 Tax=Micromonospora sp. NPDC005298 TaxID=3156873 RepID=UPI0033A5762F